MGYFVRQAGSAIEEVGDTRGRADQDEGEAPKRGGRPAQDQIEDTKPPEHDRERPQEGSQKKELEHAAVLVRLEQVWGRSLSTAQISIKFEVNSGVNADLAILASRSKRTISVDKLSATRARPAPIPGYFPVRRFGSRIRGQKFPVCRTGIGFVSS